MPFTWRGKASSANVDGTIMIMIKGAFLHHFSTSAQVLKRGRSPCRRELFLHDCNLHHWNPHCAIKVIRLLSRQLCCQHSSAYEVGVRVCLERDFVSQCCSFQVYIVVDSDNGLSALSVMIESWTILGCVGAHYASVDFKEAHREKYGKKVRKM